MGICSESFLENNKEAAEAFFKSYNDAYGKAYNEYLKVYDEAVPDIDDIKNEEDEKLLSEYLYKGYQSWLTTPLEGLGGQTPAEFIESLPAGCLRTMEEMFTFGAVICDDELPENFLEKLKGFGERAVELLINMAGRHISSVSENDFQSAVMAVKVLGKWKAELAVIPLIKLIGSESDTDAELMCQTVRDALVNIGAAAIENIIYALESGAYSDTAVEYLLIALSDIGAKHPVDKIYRQLKNSFAKMENKLIPASCLGVYGDGRAVPALRGYLERNLDKLNAEENRATYYEIISAIQKLGGRIDDLMPG